MKTATSAIFVVILAALAQQTCCRPPPESHASSSTSYCATYTGSDNKPCGEIIGNHTILQTGESLADVCSNYIHNMHCLMNTMTLPMKGDHCNISFNTNLSHNRPPNSTETTTTESPTTSTTTESQPDSTTEDQDQETTTTDKPADVDVQ